MLVTVDPGHGGSDPGAVRQGVREADVALLLAGRVGHYLRRLSDGRVRTMMTRDGDHTTSINYRAYVARSNNSTLMLSIHHNVAAAAATRGALCLISQTGAWRQRSGQVATEMLAKLDAAGLPNRGTYPDRPPYIRFRQLGVLAGTCWHMPAVLVEAGYLSNDRDRALLTDRQSREVLAICIAGGALQGLGLQPNMASLGYRASS